MKLGMIGTGAIGMPIAENILKSNIDFSFFARRNESITHLQELGGTYCSVEELGRKCDTLLLFLNTYEQCYEIIKTALKTMRSGTIVVGSTISPDEMVHLSVFCKKQGVTAIGAPVTGGVAGAKKASLTVITSGPKEIIDSLMPLFSCFGSTIVNCGSEIKYAHTMKLLVQLLVGINTAATSEVLTLGTKCGLDPMQIYSTLCESAGVSRIFTNRANTMIARDFSTRGTIEILHKDLKYAADMANEAECSIPLGKAAFDLFQTAEETLPDTHEDFSAVIKIYERRSGVTVVAKPE